MEIKTWPVVLFSVKNKKTISFFKYCLLLFVIKRLKFNLSTLEALCVCVKIGCPNSHGIFLLLTILKGGFWWCLTFWLLAIELFLCPCCCLTDVFFMSMLSYWCVWWILSGTVISIFFLLCWGLNNDTSTLVGHFVSSPREREKKNRRDIRGDER